MAVVNRTHITIVNQGVDFIVDHLFEKLTVERITDHCCFSRYYYNQLFKSVTGESVYPFIRRLRIETAAFKLIQRVMRIALISAFFAGVICWAVVRFFPAAIAALFSPESGNIKNLAESGFALFSAAFLLNGFNILITAYYTSIGSAGISLAISSLRGLILINAFVLVLPMFLGHAGIWAIYPLAGLVTLLFAIKVVSKPSIRSKVKAEPGIQAQEYN